MSATSDISTTKVDLLEARGQEGWILASGQGLLSVGKKIEMKLETIETVLQHRIEEIKEELEGNWRQVAPAASQIIHSAHPRKDSVANG